MALDLEPIKQRVAAAQPGPWFVGYEDGSGATCGKEGACITAVPAIPGGEEVGRVALVQGADFDGLPCGVLVPGDATFIAAARSDVPALIEEVERLRRERDNKARRLARMRRELKGVADPDGEDILAIDDAMRLRQQRKLNRQRKARRG